MYKNNKILVVIPARGGSKGIPRKNIRLLGGKPLIAHTIEITKASEYVDELVVTTDDNEIAFVAGKFGAKTIKRDGKLAEDSIPLDPVIYDATIKQEEKEGEKYDVVITVQPTSPLLKTKTLDLAIEKLLDIEEDNNGNEISYDTIISVVDDRHLSWGYDENNHRYFPNYIDRVAKVDLPKSFRETGAILATRRSFVKENSRLGTNIDIVEVSREESVSIEEYEDWWLAENYLKKKKIAIVVNANDEIGTSHLSRCVTIASKLVFHEVLFLIDEHYPLGVDILDKFNYSYRTYEDFEELFEIFNQYGPNIIINDILDTSGEYISSLKTDGYFVVNFEDIGFGSGIADVVFDDLYEHASEEKNVFQGSRYFILNDEFYYQQSKIITNEVNRVLVNFGNVDSNNFTEKVIDAILTTNFEGRIDVIVGLGNNRLEDLIAKYESNPLIQFYRNVSNVSEFIFRADLVFTSSDKSVYEICSLGVPTICLCQNERELSHTFVNPEKGFINLGLGNDVESQEIVEKFINLVNNYEWRLELNKRMLNVELRYGFENMLAVVEYEYRKFQNRLR